MYKLSIAIMGLSLTLFSDLVFLPKTKASLCRQSEASVSQRPHTNSTAMSDVYELITLQATHRQLILMRAADTAWYSTIQITS